MDKEILFRGKIKGSNTGYKELTWAFGNLIKEQETGRYFIIDLSHFDENTKLQDVMIEVIPETICRYTGLTDKNSRKIFEGDIVNCAENECCGDITWNESEAGFYFCVLLDGGGFEEEHLYDYVDELEVIGNIFDSPELLEGGEA